MRLPDGRRITIRPVLPQDESILQAFVRERLSAHEYPRAVAFVEELR